MIKLAEHVVRELRSKHPVLAAVIEREHQMDLKATLAALIVVDALKEVRKLSIIGLIISS
jgi:hypothetical protein